MSANLRPYQYYDSTVSICSACLQRVDAKIVFQDGGVWMLKRCPEHGPVERQLVILTVSRFNECGYFMAAHTVIASMHDVPQDVVDAIRDDRPIADERLEALRRFSALTPEKRGWVTDTDIMAFTSAGFDHAQVMEVVLAISLKTISNYVNHIAKTPLDAAFSSQAWQPRAQEIA